MVNKVRKLVVVCPWEMYIPRKTKPPKKYLTNLNSYRNIHFHEKNALKIQLKENLKSVLEGVELEYPVNVTIQIYKPSNRKLDKSNIYPVAAKYTYDALTFYGVLPDDNDDFIKTETLLPTKLNKGEGYIEFTFTTIDDS